MIKIKVGQTKQQKEKTAKDDKYYYLHQHKKPIAISAEEMETMGGAEVKTLAELLEKDNQRRAKQRIANSKSNKKRYANQKEIQAMAKELEKYKNILSQEEARAEAERKNEEDSDKNSEEDSEEDNEVFDILLSDKDIDPLNRMLCNITGTTDADINSDFYIEFITQNKLNHINHYSDVNSQLKQIRKILARLKSITN